MRLWVIGVAGALALTAMGVRDMHLAPQDAARYQAAMQAAEGMPDALPSDLNQRRDDFRAVRVQGVLAPERVTIPVEHPQMGAGVRVIQALETPEGRFALDRGFLYAAWAQDPLTAAGVEVNGTLVWENAEAARDLGADLPIIVAATPTGDGITPMPVSPEGPPVRRPWLWFAFALAWAGMTWFAAWRIKRRGEGNVTQ